MSSVTASKMANDWRELIAAADKQCIELVKQLVQQHSAELASYFYQNMLSDGDASVFLSHEQVQNRLHGSLQHWLISLFDIQGDDDLTAAIELQVKIGQIHARIKIPMHLVLRGARYLKERLHELLALEPMGATEQHECLHYFSDIIDISMEIMSQAFAGSYDRNARSDEVYRLFSITQNLSTEREKQKGALLDWENRLMFECTISAGITQLPHLGLSEFGLWFAHKGSHAFQDYPETRMVAERIQLVDEQLLPQLLQQGNQADRKVQLLLEIRDETKRIKYLLEDIFSKSGELESGRDVLTRLLNRKFLPTVLSREISHARQHHNQFALLSLDIDFFKEVNDTYGHEAGDAVLQQLSSFLVSTCRAGDFVFRLGGEEFLVILVDITEQNALMVAENIRHQIANETFQLANEQQLRLTVSSGLAMFNGHPDYQEILRNVDAALYEAKNNGRNRVVFYQ